MPAALRLEHGSAPGWSPGPAARQAGPADHGHRLVGRTAAGDQQAGDPLQMLQAHVDDDDRRTLRQGRPVELIRHLAVDVVPGQEGDGRVGGAVGDRNAGIGQAADAQPRRPARCGRERRPRPGPAASSPPRPNTKGSPPLRRSTRLPSRARATSGRRYRPAWARAARPACRRTPSARRDGRETRIFADQGVVDHHVRAAQALERGQGQQAGIAGTGASEPDPTGLQNGS